VNHFVDDIYAHKTQLTLTFSRHEQGPLEPVLPPLQSKLKIPMPTFASTLDRLQELMSLRRPVSFTVDLPTPRQHQVYPKNLTLMDSLSVVLRSSQSLLTLSTARELPSRSSL
jgi:hypothetical protein